MSDPVAKAERSKAKDLRQGITEQRERSARKKKPKDKPFRVMWKSHLFREAWCAAKFATRKEAESYIEKQGRSYGGLESAKRYWIEEQP